MKNSIRQIINKKLIVIIAIILSISTKQFAQDAAPVAQEIATPAQALGSGADQGQIDAGKALFEGNCTQCHGVSDEVVIGPGLKNVHQRRPLPWLIKWIRNSSQLVASGDAYAVEIYNKFNKTQMQSFDFSDAEITSIVKYIEAESSKAAAPVAVVAGTDVAAGQQVAVDSDSSGSMNTILVFFLIVMVLILLLLVVVISILSKYLNQKENLADYEKELINQKVDFVSVLKSKGFKALVTFAFVLLIGKSCIDGIVGIGINQGYAPTQPIPFSHKLHAGTHQIDCGYCHTGAYKSKSSGIPSANICMNCHNQVKQESPEIQKIYKAIASGKPIEWVRVHNLPDLAYFNHAQHTQVGGIKCQQCHGEIEKMEVVQQYSPLTMGWCINCHRETAVNGKDNAYYDKLMMVHNKKSKEPMKVKDNGGLECSKCHY